MSQREIPLSVSLGVFNHAYALILANHLIEKRITPVYVCIVDPQSDIRTINSQPGAQTDWLTLNIGGRIFTTTR